MWYCSQTQWNYCILDEGHAIKNSKTKVLFLLLKQLLNTSQYIKFLVEYIQILPDG